VDRLSEEDRNIVVNAAIKMVMRFVGALRKPNPWQAVFLRKAIEQ
jgi:hypothetical protein